MAKRNKILLGTLIAAVLALLIALCFVGNTFARYTLKQEESVTANIAEWGISVEDASNNSEFSTESLGTIKPLAASYADAEDDTNTSVTLPRQSGNFVKVAKLTNTGEVSANVTITPTTDENGYLDVKPEYRTMTEDELSKGAAYGVSASENTTPVYAEDEEEETGPTGYTYTPGEDYGYADTTTTGTAFASEVSQHFTADVYYDKDGALTEADDEYKVASTTEIELAAGGSIYIYLDVEWLTDLGNATDGYINGDGFDTWAGLWVSGFSFSLTVEAYQAS